jgi:hypothetical protein
MNLKCEPSCQFCAEGVCHCGCGQSTSIIKLTSAYRGYVKGKPFNFVAGHGLRGKKFSLAVRRKRSTHRNGELSKISPFLTPERIVWYQKEHGRWWCSDPSKRQVPHAKAVWEQTHGPVPEGFCVHHKNGDPKNIMNDCLGNLMLLTWEWNVRFMPVLALGFGIHEAQVTEAYCKIEYLPYEQRFPEVCKLLWENKHEQSVNTTENGHQSQKL